MKGTILEQYELAVLYHPDLEIDLDKATAKVEKQVAASDGKITATDNWGKRKMAYKIKGQEHAVYVVYTVEMPGVGVGKLNDSLNITDEVIRFLITKPDLKKIAKAEALREEKAAKQAARGEHANDDDDEKSSDDDEEERPRRRNRDDA